MRDYYDPDEERKRLERERSKPIVHSVVFLFICFLVYDCQKMKERDRMWREIIEKVDAEQGR